MQAALAQGDGEADIDRFLRLKPIFAPVAVELRHLPQGQGDGLDERHHGQDPLPDRPLQVLRLQPAQGAAHVDPQLQVIVGNFAVGAGHGGGDGPAHAGLEIPGRWRFRGWRRYRGRHGRPLVRHGGRRLLRRRRRDLGGDAARDIGRPDDPARTRSLQPLQSEAALGRQPAGIGRGLDPPGRCRRDRRRGGRRRIGGHLIRRQRRGCVGLTPARCRGRHFADSRFFFWPATGSPSPRMIARTVPTGTFCPGSTTSRSTMPSS